MIVIALEVYVEDNWYGKRYRFYYAGENGLGFKNKTEAKKYGSKLKKHIKQTRRYNGNLVAGKLDEFVTYKYLGAGPSYSCPNILIKSL